MAFSLVGGTNTQATGNNSTLTRVITVPGVPGDPQFIWAAGRASDNLADFDDPASWTRVGPVLRAYNPSLGTRPYLAVQVWWRVAPPSGYDEVTIYKVSHTNSRFRGGAIAYESDAGEVPWILGTPQVDTTGSTNTTTFTPASYTTPTGLVLCSVWAGPDLSGAMGSPTAPSGFTLDVDYSSDDPQGSTLSRQSTAGSVTMPTWVKGDATAWASLTFTLDRQRGGIYVDGAVHF